MENIYQSNSEKEKKNVSQDRELNILQIGALGLPVRRDLKYAGTERVISYLDKEFVKEGHNSMLAGTGDSEISGKLHVTIPKSLWNSKTREGGRNILFGDDAYIEHYNKVIDIASQENIDILHDHPGNGFVHSDEYLNRGHIIKNIPVLTTQHGKYLSEYQDRYNEWNKLIKKGYPIYFNAISHSQRKEFEDNTGVGISEVIYHGIPLEKFQYNEDTQDYLFSLGRISYDKGQHIAIDVAKNTKKPLVIAGEVHSVDEKYYNEKVKPHLDFSIYDIPLEQRENYKNSLIKNLQNKEDISSDSDIMFIGGLDDSQKAQFYKKASSFLMPIRWPEPFGLVMIESMATGTPIIAFNYGSVKEVVDHGKTGYVIDQNSIKGKNGNPSLEKMVGEMTYAVNNVPYLHRQSSRKRVEEYFTIEKEAKNYLNLYNKILK